MTLASRRPAPFTRPAAFVGRPRRLAGLNVTAKDRWGARALLRDPSMEWDGPADACRYFAEQMILGSLAGEPRVPMHNYAVAVASRLATFQAVRLASQDDVQPD